MSVIEDSLVENESDGVEAGVIDEHAEPEGGDRAGLYLATLIALAVPSIVVLALFLPSNNRTTPDTRTQAATTGLDTSVVSDVPEEETSVSAVVAGATESEKAPETTATPTSAAPETTASPTPTVDLSLLDPGTIEVFVYDESPAENGLYNFAIRVKSVGTPTEISTDQFTVVVEDVDGTAAETSAVFAHETLPIDSSALATVRATDTGSEMSVVRVNLGDVEVARLEVELT